MVMGLPSTVARILVPSSEPASPLGDDSQGKACPTVSGLEAEQDRVNIIKTSTLPHDSTPRVTSLATDEGSMQYKLNELTDLCTCLQRQQAKMASKIVAQELEITSLKARVKLLEDKDGGGAEPSGEEQNKVAREMDEQMVREDQRRNEQITRDTKIARIYAEEELQMLIDVEEVYVEAQQVKHLIIDWEIHTEGQRTYWKIIRLGGSTTIYQFFVDMLKHFDREDLNHVCTLVRETLSIRQATSDKEKELWVEMKRLYEPDVEDQLWTQTQALMHDLVEWRLYDSCGVHHVLSRD
nr:hypothetical protein [Tanacetum cinerariifolium]